MNSSEYYRAMTRLAQEKRRTYGVNTGNINIPILKKIYKQEGIQIDRRNNLPSKIRAAYFCEEDCSVLLNTKLPREQRIFSLAHELKHHLVDKDLIQNGQVRLGAYDENKVLEIGAEVFAAEFIFPESEMLELIKSLGIDKSNCVEKSIIDIKRATSAPISYTFIRKRLERFGFIAVGVFKKTQFKKMEEEIYGLPIYKQRWFQLRRLNRKTI